MSACAARNRRGKPCGRPAMVGATVCDYHGGKAPQVRQAAQVRVVEAKIRQVLDREGVEPVDDPVGALQRLAGEVLQLKDVLAERVSDLQSWRYESRLGAEQLRAELGLLERAQDRAGRLLTDLAKLGLDERQVRVSEAQGEMLAQAVMAALSACGLEDRLDLRAEIAQQLRLVAPADEAPPTHRRTQPGAWR